MHLTLIEVLLMIILRWPLLLLLGGLFPIGRKTANMERYLFRTTVVDFRYFSCCSSGANSLKSVREPGCFGCKDYGSQLFLRESILSAVKS